MSKSEVEKQISAKLTEKVGQSPDSITCPKDLEAKVGTKMTCTLTKGGESLPVYVTVTSVEGTTVHFDIEVGTK